MKLARGVLLGACALVGCTSERPQGEAIVRWEARQENGVYGYLIYRADRREGPFRRVNEEIVRAAGVRAESHSYAWVDRHVDVGRTYFYYLDYVGNDGRKQRFSEVVEKAVAAPGSS